MAQGASHKADGKVAYLQSGFRGLSALVSRLGLAQLAGLRFGGARDLYGIFGYKTKFDQDDFLAKYMRQDIASRIIDAPASALWSRPPVMMAGRNTTAQWEKLVEEFAIWNVMYRADRLARLNHFSIILFGLDDGSDLSRPVSKGSHKLLYLRPIGSRNVEELDLVSDPTNPRYGRPDVYRIRFDDPTTRTLGRTTVKQGKQLTVHHTRVLHIVENALEDEVIGNPIIEKCFNLLDDLLKLTGGTAETFWLSGNRGMQADIDKDMDIDPADAADLADEIDEYMHQLRRFIRTRGVKITNLGSDTPNPQQAFNMIMSLLSGTTGIPRRILLGSEVGSLASEQDRANWAERIEERRALFAWPVMLRPFIQMLRGFGVLSGAELTPEWPEAFVLNPLEAAQQMAQTARAIGNISRQTGNQKPMQLTSREEGRKIIGLEGDLPESELLEQESEGGRGRPAPGEGTPPGEDPERGTQED